MSELQMSKLQMSELQMSAGTHEPLDEFLCKGSAATLAFMSFRLQTFEPK